MFRQWLAAATALLLVSAGTSFADQDPEREDGAAKTITLEQTDDAATVAVHRYRGWGYHGYRGFYGSYPYRSFGWGYYPRYAYRGFYGYPYRSFGWGHYPRYAYYPGYARAYPWVNFGLSFVRPYGAYYYAPPVYASPWPDYCYGTGFSIGIGPVIRYSSPVYASPSGVDVLPAPRVAPKDGKYEYDGGPTNPVPMPRAEPDPTSAPPSARPIEGGVMFLSSRPAARKYYYRAYGEKDEARPESGTLRVMRPTAGR